MSDIYVPTPKQILLHKCTADELLYGGAAGGGKSRGLVMDAFLTAVQFPNIEIHMVRRTYRELEDTLIKEARMLVPRQLATYVSNAHEMRFHNGSVIKFRHLHTEADKVKFQGAEINALYIDELTHFKESEYEFLRSRVRAPRRSGMRPFVRCTSNPGGIGHSWVKKRFVDPHPDGGTVTQEIYSQVTRKSETRTIEYIPSTVLDNPHIPQSYIYALEQLPPALRDALLYGRWDAFEGQVFSEFKDNREGYDTRLWTHVVNPFPIPEHWPHWCSLDYGYKRPFSVGWWAMDEVNDIIYRYNEWYGWTGVADVGLQLNIDQFAKGIIEREKALTMGMTFTRVADPHIWDEDGGESIAMALRRHGLFYKKGDNTRLAGKMQLHYRLAFRDNGRPGIQIFKTCTQFIRTIPALTYDPGGAVSKAEDIDTKGEDHVYDETRYMLMNYKYSPPKPEIQRARPTADPLDQRKRAAGGSRYPR